MNKKGKWIAWIICLVAAIALFLNPINIQINQPIPNDNSLVIGIGDNQVVITIGNIVYATSTVDYTCDGVDDDVQVQEALDALPAGGGKLVILAGNYSFSATVLRAIDNVLIEGIGRATYIANDGATALFDAGVQSDWVFRDIRFDAGGVDVATATSWTYTNIYLGAVPQALNVTESDGTGYYFHEYAISPAVLRGGGAPVWVNPSALTLGGWNLDHVNDLLYYQVHIEEDWDLVSDPKIEFWFEVNVDNTLGNVGDTVDIDTTFYYKGNGDVANKTQTVTMTHIVGQSPRYKLFECGMISLDKDAVGNLIDAGDIFGLIINLDTAASEVDNIVVVFLEFKYEVAIPAPRS